MGKIAGVLLDTRKKTVSAVAIDDELETYYKLLGCSTIEIVPRKIGKYIVNIVCDEEGLLKSNPLTSAIDSMGNGMLVGSLFITGLADEEGDLTGLTEEEQNYIISRCAVFPTRLHPEGLMMVTECNYNF